MPRNRLDDASMSRAVGCGCVRLLFAVVGLGFSFAKVIFGAEFISKCPIIDIVPVYIVVSGCLPVLLSSLKEPYDDAGESRKCDTRIKLYIAGFAIAANLAWLIAGTVWTTSLLTVSDYGKNTCAHIHGNNSEFYGKESDTERSNSSAEIYTITTLSHRNISSINESVTGNTIVTGTEEIDQQQHSQKKPVHVNSFNAHNKDILQSKLQLNTNGSDFTINYETKNTLTSVHSRERVNNDTSLVPGSTTGKEPRCADCSVEVIFFALACVVCDWTMFGIGTVYLLYLSCHKVARLKHDWLIIRT